MIQVSDMVRWCRGIARAYGRRCWWADGDDLAQEGLAAMLSVMRNVDQEDPRAGNYLRRVAAVAMRNWLLRQSAPVHASAHSLEQLQGLRRTGVSERSREVPASRTDASGEETVTVRRLQIPPVAPRAEAELHDARWAREVRRTLDDLIARVSATPNRLMLLHSLCWAVAQEHLIDGVAPKTLALKYGVDVRRIYRITRDLRRAIERSRKLYQLTKERCG